MKRQMMIFFLIPLLFFAGCEKREQKAVAGEEKGGEERVTLSIGVMPAVDTAPIFLAEEKGYFGDFNLDLDITLFTNAQDRQSALQTGEIDGAMTDLVAVAVNVANGFDIKATTLTDGMFPILAVPGAVDKNRLKVGMMEISVSNFLVDQWLAGKYEIEKVYINSIPGRLTAVLSGQLDMGIFPEPIASVGEMQGLEKLVFDPVDGFSPDVMVFTGRSIKEKREAIMRFHRGYDRAVADIGASEEEARDILIRSIPNLKPEIKPIMTLPSYRKAGLPGEEYLKKIITWTQGISGQETTLNPEDLVDRSFTER